jgi:hypothetical protein
MNKRIFLRTVLIVGSALSSLAAKAAVDLPFETIKQMAEINPVNGRCALEQVQIRDQDGKKSLSLNLKIDGRDIPSSLALSNIESVWSESQGVNAAQKPFWRFVMTGADRSSRGALIDIDWRVEGDDFKTSSLAMKFLDPDSNAEVEVGCL